MKKTKSLRDFWPVDEVRDDGIIVAKDRIGFLFDLTGLDAALFTEEQLNRLHQRWRATLSLSPGDELQIVFEKRVEFAEWIEAQLRQAFLTENTYGRKVLLDRLAAQVSKMSQDRPQLLSQKITACYWCDKARGVSDWAGRRRLVHSQLENFGFKVRTLDRKAVERAVNPQGEWPEIHLDVGSLNVEGERFRAVELVRLPESRTQLGMIQALTRLPYPLMVGLRLRAVNPRPIVRRLERKRNILKAQQGAQNAAEVESQSDQLNQVLRGLADRSETIFEMSLVAGLSLPSTAETFQRQALNEIVRAALQMDFAEFEEATLHSFDCFLECRPALRGQNIKTHTVLASNAAHFLPLFRPARGDPRAIVSFETREQGLFALDPVDSRLANYNWLVSGTSGAGKSFFVNSLLMQSLSLKPNIFIVDIGGSYNRLIKYLGGQVLSLEPGTGFQLSPFFLNRRMDAADEGLRRQHIFQVFLEMIRIEDESPSIEVRHALMEAIDELLNLETLPAKPITALLDRLSEKGDEPSRQLALLLEPWAKNNYYARFLDNDCALNVNSELLTIDLKGLTDFPDLARVVQLIVCAALWARVRATKGRRFSWIVLDEVAFSLLKTQPQFVDELVSTLRKYYAGAVIVVQDLEKITSNVAGAGILQNTQSKAILQQRGDPGNFSQGLGLNPNDVWAIESLQREKGSFSDIFLVRDSDRTVIRHRPSELEYWLATTDPSDLRTFDKGVEGSRGLFQGQVLDFVRSRNVEGGT